jgi:hypothetical protein
MLFNAAAATLESEKTLYAVGLDSKLLIKLLPTFFNEGILSKLIDNACFLLNM